VSILRGRVKEQGSSFVSSFGVSAINSCFGQSFTGSFELCVLLLSSVTVFFCVCVGDLQVFTSAVPQPWFTGFTPGMSHVCCLRKVEEE